MSAKKAVEWFTVIKERFVQTEVMSSSVMIAYYLLLSLFPLSIAVGNILPYLNLSPEVVLPYINTVVPLAVQPVLDPIITGLLTNSSGGLLSISAIGLIWSSSRGIRYLQKGMNKAYDVVTSGRFLIKRAISMLMVLLVLVLLVVFIILFGMGQSLMVRLGELIPGVQVFNQYVADLKWPAIIIFLFCLLIVTYCVVPDVKLRPRDVWAGSLFSTAGVLLLTQLFTIYMQFTTRNFNSYGALGAFFILMFWLNFICVIILLGAVLNAAINEIRHGKAQPQRSRIDDYVTEKTTAWMEKWEARQKKGKTGAKKKSKAEEAGDVPKSAEQEPEAPKEEAATGNEE